ncbi:MAG TPA: alpha-L-arabinofuranosidase C-terminal domain-containing protein, partial [Trebonia sp.]|nr:alpha-L-arabinofuranosidase C-terminal domain-containing protein [Trebonia sp.]
DYWTNVLQPHQAERAIATTAALIDRTAHLTNLPGKPAIAYDEWNVWYRTGFQNTGTVDLAERYTFDDALAVATYLNIFVRNCARVRMANLAQMVNAIAPIVTTDTAAAVQPIYYPFLLHARAALAAAVDVHVDGPVVAPELPQDASRWPHRIADLGPFALVDAAASVSADRGKLTVTLVNRAPDAAEEARLVLRDYAFAGLATVTTLTAADAQAARPGLSSLASLAPLAGPPSLSGTAGAHLAETAVPVHSPAFALTLPPRSFTVVEAPVTASP